MQCPHCGSDNDKVIDSRSSEGNKAVRRRRVCLACSRRFTTYERVDDALRITVVKKDGSRMPYNRDKILTGLRLACYKRPVSDEQLRKIVDSVEEDVFANFEKEVSSRYIGDAVSDHLRRLDEVAYIRFASVYRQFQDLGQIIQEAEGLRDAPAETPGQRHLFGEKAEQ